MNEQETWTLEEDPYNKPVYVQGHSHAEPICAVPGCETYLTRVEMAALQALAFGPDTNWEDE